LHSFCRLCLIEAINNDASPTGVVNCPMKIISCSSVMEDEEVRALLGSDHEAFILKVILSLDEMAKEKGGRLFETLPALLDAENYNFIPNTEAFECVICFGEIEIGDGVVLKECLHKFCKVCLIDQVKHSDESEVKCPFIDGTGSCEFKIQHREIRGLVPSDVLDKHLEKSLKFYENQSEDAYHCKTPDCRGFIEKDADLRGFTCQVCSKVNCIGCKAIHENQNCVEHQDTINPGGRQRREDEESENAIKNLIAAEQAMWCPKCGIPVMKDDGCDYITCTACKLGICWRTKKPRHPITKTNGEVIDGCHCNFAAGQRCHPLCGNCH
jgi:RanBP-type and C3HC4-type zinc finger-containing protein 1